MKKNKKKVNLEVFVSVVEGENQFVCDNPNTEESHTSQNICAFVFGVINESIENGVGINFGSECIESLFESVCYIQSQAINFLDEHTTEEIELNFNF